VTSIAVRPYLAGLQRAWAEETLATASGGPLQARRGELIDVLAASALVADLDGERAGLLTYRFDLDGCELTSLVSIRPGRGVGRALLGALVDAAKTEGVDRVWVVTSNDNTRALRFYQRAGFRLVALRVGAVTEARTRLKPSIGRFGEDDIPIRDELELELALH
jgi:ribosomal protein S18 acetylase RimI-like enzyme